MKKNVLCLVIIGFYSYLADMCALNAESKFGAGFILGMHPVLRQIII